MKKVAIVFHKTDLTGGPGHIFLNSIPALNHNIFDYHVLTSQVGELNSKLEQLSIKVKNIPYAEIKRSNPLPFLICLVRVMFWYLFNKIQLVHFQFDYYRDPFFLAAKLLKIKTIIHVHGPSRDPFLSWFSSADAFIFNSTLTASNSFYTAISDSKKHIIHYGINPDYYKIAKKQKTEKIIIANISRIHPAKNLEEFITIAELINKKLQAEFWIVGDWQDLEYLKKLQEQVKRLKLEDQVKFLGHQKIENIYPQLDLIIHTATNEPFGIIYLEAALFQVPVLAVSPGGIHDIFRDQIDGRMYKAGNCMLAANLACELIENKNLSNKYTANFYNKVVSQYSANIYQRNLESFYLKLLC